MPPAAALTTSVRTRCTRIEAALSARPLLWAVVLAAVIAVVFTTTLNPGYETNDDVAMQSTADGSSYGEPLPHLVFSNVLIGLLLSSLYRAVEWFPWYGLYLYLAHFAALIVAVYVVLSGRRGRLWVRLLGLAAVLAAFHLPMWMQLQFTSTAILLGASGVVLYWAVAHHVPARWSAIAVAGVMLGLSSWIRWHSAGVAALLALPILVLSLRRIPWRRQAVFAASAALMVAVGSVSQALYYHGRSDWQAYFDFNATRGALQQSPDLTNLDPAVLTEVGWSVNDLRMFQRWFSSDENVYQAEDLDVIADALPTTFRWGKAAGVLGDQGRGWLGGLRVATITTLAALAWIEGNRHARQVLAVAIATVATIAFALAATAKLPDRVAVPMIAFTALLCLPTPMPGRVQEPAGSGRAGRAWRALTAIVFGATTVAGSIHALALNEQQHRIEAHLQNVLSGLEQIDPDGLFVSWGGQLPLNGQSLSPWQRGGLGGPLLLGLGWQQRSPMQQEMLASRGIEDVYAAIATREDVYLPLLDPVLKTLYQQYLREHYAFPGLLRPTEGVGRYTVYHLAVTYHVNDRVGALVERRLDGTRLTHDLAESDSSSHAVISTEEDGTLVITGRADADLVVITNRTRAFALVEPNEPTDEDDPGGFRVSLHPTPNTLRIFALSGEQAVEITP